MRADLLRGEFARDHIRARPGDRVLDIGCGPANLIAYLPDVDYVGWDPNSAYIAHAEKIYAGRGEFHVGLFGPEQARSLAPVDIAIVSAVLHHLHDRQAIHLFDLLRQTLKPGGRVVTVDPVYTSPQNPIARLVIRMDRGRHVRTADAFAALARHCFKCVSGKVVNRAFPPYSYFFMTAQ